MTLGLSECCRLFACDALLGAPPVPPDGYTPDVQDLEAEMSRLGISTSVVRHRACLDANGHFGNLVLMEEIAGHSGLIPAWFVTPDGYEPDFAPEALVDRMLAAGVRLAWTDPAAQDFSLQPWCSGRLLSALQERRVPLLLRYSAAPLSDLHQALEAYPQLRTILLDVPRYGRNRPLEALLALHPHLYLCFGPSFSVHEGFRDLVSRYGQERWVWGAGYPSYEGGAAIAGLAYSGLSASEMEAVAHLNMERLLAEVEV